MGDVKTFANFSLGGAAGQKPQHVAYMSHFQWLSLHKHPRLSRVSLPKSRSHTAYPASASLAEVHLGIPAVMPSRWTMSMSEPLADTHSGIVGRSAPESARLMKGF
jgi:hypothetical protein